LRGAQLLDRLLPGLDVFVLFSSIGAFLPHPGVANYAAANAGLDALARDRRARGFPALSIAWGPWENAGLALGEAGEHAVTEMARLGIQAIPIERGTALFAWICEGDGPTATVMSTDWSRFRQARGWRREALFRDLIADQPAASLEQSTLLCQLKAAGPEQRRQLLQDLTRSAISRVLKIAPSRIDSRKTLGNMGLNSLMAIELRNQLEAALGRPISVTLAWNYPTVDAIVGYLVGNEMDAPERPNPTMTQPSSSDALSRSLLDVAAMSDEAAMLALLGQSAEAAQ
jgi:acyl carrier protein